MTIENTINSDTTTSIRIRDFTISGCLYLIYPIKIEDFIEKIVIYPESHDNRIEITEAKKISHYVNRFRGTDEFEKFCGKKSVVKTASENKKIELNLPNDKDSIIRENGYNFSTFRRNLTDNWLSIDSKYYFQQEEYQIPGETNPFELTCNYYVRLSYSGIVELRKEISLENVNLLLLLKFLSGLRTELTDEPKNQSNSSWEYVKKVFSNYITSELPKKTEQFRGFHLNKLYEIVTTESQPYIYPENVKDEPVLQHTLFVLKAKKEIEENTQKRHRYAIILADTIKNTTVPQKRITRIETEHHPLIGGILEGSLEKTNDGYKFPKMSTKRFKDLIDLTTWEEEFCYMGTERTFIYYENIEITFIDHVENDHSYKNYWECIIRGIEHSVSVSALLQIIHNQTTEYLCDVPNLVRRFAEINKKDFENNSELNDEKAESAKKMLDEEKKQLHKDLFDFAFKVANISNIVPKVRDICIPSSAFRSGNVVEKFEYLNEKCFYFSTILRNITDNVNELSDYLLFFQQQEVMIKMDEEGEQVENQDLNLNKIASLLTLTSIIFVSASFWNDFYQFIENKCFFYGCGKFDFKAVFAFLLYFLIIAIVFVIFRKTLKEIFKTLWKKGKK
jgi:hypothetical protein